MSTQVRMPRSPKPLGLRFGDKAAKPRKSIAILPDVRQIAGPAVAVDAPPEHMAPPPPKTEQAQSRRQAERAPQVAKRPEERASRTAEPKPARAAVRHRLIDASTRRTSSDHKPSDPGHAQTRIDTEKLKREVEAARDGTAPAPETVHHADLRQKISVNRNRWLANATNSPYARRRYPKFMEAAVPRYAVIAGLATVITVAAGTFLQQTGEANKLTVPPSPTAAETAGQQKTIDVVSR